VKDLKVYIIERYSKNEERWVHSEGWWLRKGEAERYRKEEGLRPSEYRVMEYRAVSQ
jgi:hypothetical protein